VNRHRQPGVVRGDPLIVERFNFTEARLAQTEAAAEVHGKNPVAAARERLGANPVLWYSETTG